MKKQGKSVLFWGLVFCLVVFAAWPIHSALAAKNTEITLNGILLPADVDPVIIDDYTFVPLRVIVEKLDAQPEYLSETQTIHITAPNMQIQMQIGSASITVNGKTSSIPVAPILLQDRVLVPLRFVSETLNCEVKWTAGDGENPNEVQIYTETPVKLDSGHAAIAVKHLQFSKELVAQDRNISVSYDVVLPEFSGMEDTAFQEKINQEFQSEYREIVQRVEDNLAEQESASEEEPYYFTEDMKFHILGESNAVLSLVMEYFTFAGGAHGIPLHDGLNIDFNHSKILELDDIFKEPNSFIAVLLQKMNALRVANPAEYEEVSEITELSHYFYFDHQGNLVVFYQPYDLAPYARGFVYFELPLTQLTEYLLPEYAAH